jgi:hypothetical protein
MLVKSRERKVCHERGALLNAWRELGRGKITERLARDFLLGRFVLTVRNMQELKASGISLGAGAN